MGAEVMGAHSKAGFRVTLEAFCWKWQINKMEGAWVPETPDGGELPKPAPRLLHKWETFLEFIYWDVRIYDTEANVTLNNTGSHEESIHKHLSAPPCSAAS